tara:strand:+ start:17398 stop:18609 length:1212 start_codon:yes stop_codon:yes gene_type:complete
MIFNPHNEWLGMPEFKQEKKEAFRVVNFFIGERKIICRFDNDRDVDSFIFHTGINLPYEAKRINLAIGDSEYLSKLFDQKITDKSKSIWYPYKSHWGLAKNRWKTETDVLPKYPVYIVSKGRAHNGLTTKALTNMKVCHFIVVEDGELNDYLLSPSVSTSYATLLTLPKSYLDDYDTCDDLGNTRSKGPGAARNFCLDHSKENGFKRHWVMDDNLDAFHRLNDNEKYEVETGATLLAAEDFVDRYSNVPVAGLNYYSFCKKTDKVPPFIKNTRIYSCLLIENDAGYRWRGRYNEDTDLSLRVLKDGLCTIQFNAFLCGKVTTQRMRGGNSKEFYDKEGTLPKSKMLEDLHPDVSKVVWRFNRWHHSVNYKPFKDNELIRISDKPENKINNYSMSLTKEGCHNE